MVSRVVDVEGAVEFRSVCKCCKCRASSKDARSKGVAKRYLSLFVCSVWYMTQPASIRLSQSREL